MTTDQNLDRALTSQREKILNGGPGSGVKGHTTDSSRANHDKMISSHIDAGRAKEQAAAWLKTELAHGASEEAWTTGDKETHRVAAAAHEEAAKSHEAAGNTAQARLHRGTIPNHRMMAYEAPKK